MFVINDQVKITPAIIPRLFDFSYSCHCFATKVLRSSTRTRLAKWRLAPFPAMQLTASAAGAKASSGSGDIVSAALYVDRKEATPSSGNDAVEKELDSIAFSSLHPVPFVLKVRTCL